MYMYICNLYSINEKVGGGGGFILFGIVLI